MALIHKTFEEKDMAKESFMVEHLKNFRHKTELDTHKNEIKFGRMEKHGFVWN